MSLTSLPYSNRSVRGPLSFANNEFSKRNTEDVMRLVASVIAPGAHGHTFCSN